jgi:hypothetical protein
VGTPQSIPILSGVVDEILGVNRSRSTRYSSTHRRERLILTWAL